MFMKASGEYAKTRFQQARTVDGSAHPFGSRIVEKSEISHHAIRLKLAYAPPVEQEVIVWQAPVGKEKIVI
jgi:hypothetical protein